MKMVDCYCTPLLIFFLQGPDVGQSIESASLYIGYWISP